MTYLPERIRMCRERLGLSQGDLGALIGKNQKQISQYEKGQVQPSASVLYDLADTLGTTSDYLLGLTDNFDRPLRNSSDLDNLERELIQLLRRKPRLEREKYVEFIRTW